MSRLCHYIRIMHKRFSIFIHIVLNSPLASTKFAYCSVSHSTLASINLHIVRKCFFTLNCVSAYVTIVVSRTQRKG